MSSARGFITASDAFYQELISNSKMRIFQDTERFLPVFFLFCNSLSPFPVHQQPSHVGLSAGRPATVYQENITIYITGIVTGQKQCR